MPGGMDVLRPVGAAAEAPIKATGLVNPAGNLISSLEGSLPTPLVGIKSLAVGPGDFSKLEIPGPKPGNPEDLVASTAQAPGNPDALVIPGAQAPGNPENLVVSSGGSTRTKEVGQNGGLGSSEPKADGAPAVQSDTAPVANAEDAGVAQGSPEAKAQIGANGEDAGLADEIEQASVDARARADEAAVFNEEASVVGSEPAVAQPTAEAPGGAPAASSGETPDESVLREARHNELLTKENRTPEEEAELAGWESGIEPTAAKDLKNNVSGDSVLVDARLKQLEGQETRTPEQEVELAGLRASREQAAQARQAEPATAKPAEATAKTPAEAEKARTDKLKSIGDKQAKGEPLTIDEWKTLRDEAQYQDALKTSKENPGNLTDKQIEMLTNRNAPEGAKDAKPNSAENLTPAQQKEKLKKDIDALGEKLMNKFANGEDVTEEDLEELRNLQSRQSLENKGFTPDQARGAMREAMRGGRTGGERMGRSIKELQGEIQKVMALYLRLMAIPKTVDQLRFARQDAIYEAKAKHSEAAGAMSDEQKLQKKGEEYNALMKVANYNALIAGQKYMVPVLQAQIGDMEQSIRRRLGVTSGFEALCEFAGAKVRNVATDIRVVVTEEKDHLTGMAA